jgi:hypothetical protein
MNTGETIIHIHHYENVKPPNLIQKTEVQFSFNMDITRILFLHKEQILLQELKLTSVNQKLYILFAALFSRSAIFGSATLT